MSNFNCGYCGTPILDSQEGYITECEHYPIDTPYKKKAQKKEFIIEFKSKIDNTHSALFINWSKYKKYKTEKDRDKALLSLANDKYFEYRKRD